MPDLKRNLIFIDFETRSRAPLKKTGVTRYAKDPTTDVICLGYMWPHDNTASLWTPYLPAIDFPDDAKFVAWNAEFELAIWNYILVPRYGFNPIDKSMIIDAQAMAMYQNIPPSLDGAAEFMLNKHKDPTGKRLIGKLSIPQRNGEFIKYEDEPELFTSMYAYCRKDVELTRELYEKLPRLPIVEERVWKQTVAMNQRGVPIDEAELQACIRIIELEKERENSKVPFITNGEVLSVTQVAKLKTWIGKRLKRNVDSLNKSSVEAFLNDENTPRDVKEVLRIRQKVGLSTNAKYMRAAQMIIDGYVHDAHRYFGAHTGRLSGKGMQLQNLKRAKVSEFDADFFMKAAVNDDMDMLRLIHGNDLLTEMSKLIRSLIKAPPGKRFICADYSSIEAVAVPWLAGEQDLLDDIAKGLDQYKRMASLMFGIDYDNVTEEQRQIGKIDILACGYAGGANALIGMAIVYGLYPNVIDEIKAQTYVQLFRKARPRLVLSWKLMGEAAYRAVSKPGTLVHSGLQGVHDISFIYKNDALVMILPSGHEVIYPEPRPLIEESWRNSISVVVRKRIMTMSGANFFQNAVQAICRDLLMHAQLKLEENGYPLVLSVHDECMAMVDEDDTSKNINDFISIMTDAPSWAIDMPVKADGWEGYRYRK